MKYLFYLAHPAHFHLFKNIILKLQEYNHKIIVTYKTKDVITELINNLEVESININPKERGDSKFGIYKNILQRNIKTFGIVKEFNPNIILSTSLEFAPISSLLKIPFLHVNEDDFTLSPLLTNLFVPFVNHIICPNSCNTGKWQRKTIHYNGNQELTYLHPKYFKPNFLKVKKYIDASKKNFLIRFSKLAAWHDKGKTGITDIIARNIVKKILPFGNVFISSERVLNNELDNYRIKIDPSDMHDFLFYCDLYIGDSQTMCAEAAVLGTPSIRFNDFVGKLGYLNELEKNYELTIGIKTDEVDKLYLTIDKLLKIPQLKKIWKKRSERFISDKIDVTEFILRFLINYPNSVNEYFNNPQVKNNYIYF